MFGGFQFKNVSNSVFSELDYKNRNRENDLKLR